MAQKPKKSIEPSVQADPSPQPGSETSISQEATPKIGEKIDGVGVGVLKVIADEVNFQYGVVGSIEAGNIEFSDGLIGSVQAQQSSTNDTIVGMVIANTVELQETQANKLIARDVHGSSVRTSILLAGNVEGPVETYLDTRQALMAGLAAGIGAGIVLLLKSFFTHRRV